MAKTASDTNTASASAEQALKRRKKQARREAKLMLEIEKAQKDLKQAQKQQSKAQARLEAQSTSLQTLEARLAELRAQSLEPEIGTPPQSAELEHQQEPSELESSIGSSDGQQLASPDQEHQGESTALTDQAISLPQVEDGIGNASSSSETGTSTSIDAQPTSPLVEEATPSEVMVVTDEVTEREAVQDNETATETDPAPTPATPAKAPAQKTAAARKPAATKRPANRSRSRQSPSDPG
jgi:predicted RNase H-like nuclease (RuvC/YqgF family)